ncbi:hypothetical protein K503DRAFT_870917 [Rhizopogon vinicolor AM-OR11-026]|uniref:Uncharacterized protein n=1 Tax=Rhizopogon vinicolor AM-OR11-026 TaxID=1314800 RepID=A0A1B7MDM2_9AGAM|nr:hypothetical protein K503DRAFT_870917 [Rhizopogon vinicolor AM-OR11-026]
MRFSIFATVITLTAAMSASACYYKGHSCKVNSDCCAVAHLECDTADRHVATFVAESTKGHE